MRRSCETEFSSARRSRSVASSARALDHASSLRACSTASAAWVAKLLSIRRSAIPSPESAGPPAMTASTPTGWLAACIGMVTSSPLSEATGPPARDSTGTALSTASARSERSFLFPLLGAGTALLAGADEGADHQGDQEIDRQRHEVLHL